MMDLRARLAGAGDLAELERLYGLLAAEMTALDDLWPITFGLGSEPAQALARAVADPDRVVVVGTIDGVVVGFCLAHRMAPGESAPAVGFIRLIFTEPAARGVGVGDAMWRETLDDLRSGGCNRFDAAVPPGHRAAKNFFEQHGFSARAITMHGR